MSASKGSKRLRELVSPKPPKSTIADVAEKCGVTKQAVSQWMAGFVIPKEEHRATLKKMLGIPESDWESASPAATGTEG